jgi:hypothetical protein
MAEPIIEVIKAVNEMVSAQADQLWTISISMTNNPNQFRIS